MKILGLIAFLAFNTLYAEVIDSAPLSVEDDGARRMMTPARGAGEKEVVGTLVPVEATVNPEDGQLQLNAVDEDKKVETVSSEVTVTKEVQVQTVHSDYYTEPPMRSSSRFEMGQYARRPYYLQLAYGRLNSRYEKIYPTLDNGSVLMSARFASDMNDYFQAGIAVEIIKDRSPERLTGNIRALQYRLSLEHHAPFFHSGIHWLGGLSLSVGNYSVRRLSTNSQGQLVSTSLNHGTMIGLIPAMGLSFRSQGKGSLDIMAEYHHYFKKPQTYLGGFAVVPRLSLLF